MQREREILAECSDAAAVWNAIGVDDKAVLQGIAWCLSATAETLPMSNTWSPS